MSIKKAAQVAELLVATRFDLMIMGFKLQLMSVSPAEIVDVTNNHLEELRRLAGEGDGVVALVEECVSQVPGSQDKESFFILYQITSFFI